MRKIFELELWSRPGKNLDPEYGHRLATAIKNDLELENEIVAGLSFIPCKAHVDNLKISFNERELFQDDFFQYCIDNSMLESIDNEYSAAAYLEYKYGRNLAWLHIPHDVIGLKKYKKILCWTHIHKLNLQDDNLLYCIAPDLEIVSPLQW